MMHEHSMIVCTQSFEKALIVSALKYKRLFLGFSLLFDEDMVIYPINFLDSQLFDDIL